MYSQVLKNIGKEKNETPGIYDICWLCHAKMNAERGIKVLWASGVTNKKIKSTKPNIQSSMLYANKYEWKKQRISQESKSEAEEDKTEKTGERERIWELDEICYRLKNR